MNQANVCLWWMVDEASRHGLRFDATRLTAAKADERFRPDPLGPIHESLSSVWWPLELWPKRYWDWDQESFKVRIPLGGRRFIDAEASIAPSVNLRRANTGMGYAPPNLPK